MKAYRGDILTDLTEFSDVRPAALTRHSVEKIGTRSAVLARDAETLVGI